MRKKLKCRHCRRIIKILRFYDIKGNLWDSCRDCRDKGLESELWTIEKYKIRRRYIRKPRTSIKDKLYVVWHEMVRRCHSPKYKGYHNYGGRGIKVCAQWYKFLPFYEWALANGYKISLRLDRINNDGDYEPTNCHFVTHKQNCNNTRKSRYVEHNGLKMTISQWADYLNIPYHKLYQKLKSNNFNIANISN